MKRTDKFRRIPFSPPDVGEKEAEEIAEAVRSGWITTGPRVKLLEKRLACYFQTGRTTYAQNSSEKRVACLGSSTAALELNLRVLGIGPGDEVVVPAYTYTATASPVIHCGAKIIFADIRKNGDPATHAPEMDYDALANAITPQTKAIIAADLCGPVCDYDRLFEIARSKRHLFTPKESDGTTLGDLSSKIQKGLGCPAILADCAHSLGASRLVRHTGCGPLDKAEWRNCGTIANFSSFSFHAVKNFTTAEGGASTWCLPASVYARGISDEDIYHMYQLLSLHGQSKAALEKSEAGSWEYDVIGPWYKCNMTDISAAMGLVQMDRYEGMLERRSKIIKSYDRCCDELGIAHLNHKTEAVRSSMHLYPIRIPQLDESGRNELMQRLAEMGVSTNVHFKPLPMFTAYRALGWDISQFPNSYDYYRCLITLPLYSKLTDEDVQYICGSLKEVVCGQTQVSAARTSLLIPEVTADAEEVE